MSKPGPKEQQLRDMRDMPTFLRRGHPDCPVKATPSPVVAKPKTDAGVTLAPPLSVQKAIAADFAEPQTEATSATATPEAQPQGSDMRKTKSAAKAKSKKTSKQKARTSVKTANGHSKKSTIVDMLKSTNGATMDAMKKATGWTPHSIHGLIGALRAKDKMKVVAKKEGDANVYRIAS